MVDACAIELRSAAGEASLAFRNGKARGTANLALGEGCAARGARLEVVRAP